MTTLEAHELIAAAGDSVRGWLPDDVSVRAVAGLDPTAALLTAACELSGMLDDAKDLADLRRAVEHFNALLSSEVLTLADWTAESESVIAQVLAWGDKLMAEHYAGELN